MIPPGLIAAQSRADLDAYATVVTGLSGLVAYWRLGDTSTATLADNSGNGHDGSYGGTPLFGQTGLVFDSEEDATRTDADGWGEVAHASALAPASGAFGVWFQVHDLTNAATIVQKGTDFQIVVESDGRIRLLWRGQAIETFPTHAETGVRNHAFVAWDGTDVRFYVDGFLAGGLNEGSGLSNNTAAWQFGRSTGGVVRDMTLHEAVLYDDKKGFAEAVDLAEGQRGLGYRAALDTITVSTAAELNDALTNAAPGDHIVLADGDYDGGFTLSASGTNENQIVVKAQNPRGARFTGGDFVLSGDWLVVDGLDTDRVSQFIVQGNRCRVARCRRRFFDDWGVLVKNGARHARVDHCELTEPDQAASNNQPIKVETSSFPENTLLDHLFLQYNGSDHGNGHDGIAFGASGFDSDRESYSTAYRCLLDDYNHDENISGKAQDLNIWYCTFRNGNVYTQDRHSRRHEWRSCYFKKHHRSQGDAHRFIGCTFDGTGNSLRLGAGDCTQDQFEGDPGGFDRPASTNAKIAGCTFLNGSEVIAGADNGSNLSVKASGAVAEGNVNWAVTHTQDYDGTITNGPTTDEWFEEAVELQAADVGFGASDPLVPAGLT